MQGCGLLCDPTLPASSAPDERVLNFTMAGNWQVASEPLHPLWESYTPVHVNFLRAGTPEDTRSTEEIAAEYRSNPFWGAGLGISFGAAMADAEGKPIGLISAAHGGTSLDQWSPNLKSEGGASLYGSMLDRIQKAGGKLRGILWYQGESDGLPELDATYAERFEEWVRAVRSDTGQPDLPVIVVQLGRVVQVEEGWPAASWNIVREAQRTLPDHVPNTAVAPAIDLGLCDTIHIDTPGLTRLGKRMARLALALQSGAQPGPRLSKIEKGPDQSNGFGLVQVHCEGVEGGWNPKTHLGGFTFCSQDGTPHPSALVIEANVDAQNPKIINIITHPSADETMFLAYGLGINPYCNVVDDADQALPTFAPQPIA